MKKTFLKIISFALMCVLLLSSCAKGGNGTSDVTDGESDSETLPEFKWQNDPNKDGEKNEYKDDNGAVLNIDSDALYYFARTNNYDYTNLDVKARSYFDQYVDKGLSDIIYNIDGSCPSETREFKGDVYNPDDENKSSLSFKVHRDIFIVNNYDPFATWIELCRENGINPWLSFRMNDVHYANDPNAYHSEFYYTAKQNGWFIGSSHSERWTDVGGSAAWFPYALNYAIPEVRQYFLDYIDEMLNRYDVYGIELDWQRTIWCFSEDSADNCKYMNTYMNDLDVILKKHEQKYGHEIKTMARINRDIDENVILGFDVINWAENSWIDVVVPSPYWGVTDSDMPIAEWVERLKNYDVEIYAGLEDDVFGERDHDMKTLAAFTAQYLSQGADKIYMFNLMEWDPVIWKVCSSMQAAMNVMCRSYVITHSNCGPYGNISYDPLPMDCSIFNESNELTVNHGTLDYEKNIFIYIGVSYLPSDTELKDILHVYFGDVECVYSGASTDSWLKDTANYTVYKFVVPMDKVAKGNSTVIKFVPEQSIVIDYIELANGRTA